MKAAGIAPAAFLKLRSLKSEMKSDIINPKSYIRHPKSKTSHFKIASLFSQ